MTGERHMEQPYNIWENFPSFRWGAEAMEIYDAPINLTSISSVVGTAIRVISGWASAFFWRILMWMARVALGSKEAVELGETADRIASRLGNAILGSWVLVGGIVILGFAVAVFRFARGTGRTNNARNAAISVLCLVLLIGYVAASTVAHNRREEAKKGAAAITQITTPRFVFDGNRTVLDWRSEDVTDTNLFLSASWILDKGTRLVSSLSQYGSELLNIVDLETQDTEEISESPLDCRYYIDTINRETLAAGSALDTGTRFTAKALSDIWLLLQYRPAANAQWGSSAFSPQVYCRLLESRTQTPGREMHRLTVAAAAGPDCEAKYVANTGGVGRGAINDITNIPSTGYGDVAVTCKSSTPDEPFLGLAAPKILGNRVRDGYLFGKAGAARVYSGGDEEGLTYSCASAQPGDSEPSSEPCYITHILGIGAHNEYIHNEAPLAGRPQDIYSPSGSGRQYIGGIDYYQTVRTANFWAMCRPKIPPFNVFPNSRIRSAATNIASGLPRNDAWFLRIHSEDGTLSRNFRPVPVATLRDVPYYGALRPEIQTVVEDPTVIVNMADIDDPASIAETLSSLLHGTVFKDILGKDTDWIKTEAEFARDPLGFKIADALGVVGGQYREERDTIIEVSEELLNGYEQAVSLEQYLQDIINHPEVQDAVPDFAARQEAATANPGTPNRLSAPLEGIPQRKPGSVAYKKSDAPLSGTAGFYDPTHFMWELRPEFASLELTGVIRDIASQDYSSDDTIVIAQGKPLAYYFGDIGTGQTGTQEQDGDLIGKPRGGHVCATVWTNITGEGVPELALERCEYRLPLGGTGPIKTFNRSICGMQTRILVTVGVERAIVLHDYTNVAPLGGGVFELQPGDVSPFEYASSAPLNREVRVWMEEANDRGGTGFLSGAFHIALSAFVSMVLFFLVGMILVLVFAAQIMLLVSLALLPILLLLGVLPFQKTQEALGRIVTLILVCIGVKFIVGMYLSTVVILLYVVLVAGNAILGPGFGVGHLILTGFAAALLLIVSLKVFRKSLAYAKKLRKESTFRGKQQSRSLTERAIGKAKRVAHKAQQSRNEKIGQVTQSATRGGGRPGGGGAPPATGGTGGVPPSLPTAGR